MQNIISIKNIPNSKDVTPREYTWLDTKYVKAPNVIGKNRKELSNMLKGFNVEYSGTGDSVIYQEPAGETYIKVGSTIKVMLN